MAITFDMMSSCRGLFMMISIIVASNFLSSSVTAQNVHYCYRNGTYTRNSTYEANLNTVMSSIFSNIVSDNGFYNASAGQNRERVNAVALCRGDVLLPRCRDCIQQATDELRSSCPNQTRAIIWSEFCMLRYSNNSILGLLANGPGYWLWNMDNATSPNRFRADVIMLLDDLLEQAANGGPVRKVAGGSRSGPDNQTISALVQCTPDLTPEDCILCLTDAAAQLPDCCDRKRGGRVLTPSCSLRYETYPFYNETRLQELGLSLTVSAPPPSSPVLETVPAVPSPPGNGDNDTTRTVIIVVASVVGCLITVVVVAILLRKIIKQRRNKQLHHETIESEDDISTVESLQYDFGQIRAATNDFSDANKLGQGGFGAVYKGKLPNGQEIAVKRLSRDSGQGGIEFKNEVLLLARLQHRNLVKFLGFSLEGIEKLLVYEYVPNASLDQFIFDSSRRSDLDWDKRHKIIGGIARGLLYLHEDSRLRIIHRDLKASNVLLDGDMNPKIADFGMARLFDVDETHNVTSRIVGTYGYMAPEYAIRGQFSIKSDVFSFGVLVLEIISGQKNSSFSNGENTEDLLSYAWRNWQEGVPTNLIDPVLRAASDIPRDMLRCIHIALLCVQDNASDRPTMTSVVLMLNSFSITLPVPSIPAFSIPIGNDSAHELKPRETESTKSSQYSKNDVSITELYPR